MKAELERNGSKLVIRVGEELTAVTALELKALVDEAVDDDVKEVVFDVTEMPYTSSAGLRVFLATQYLMDDRDGELKLIGVNEMVSEILEETGFTDFMNVETVE